ncbi:MAG TPA: hypothetical protein VLR90_22290, partial [Blastocatellia bacterium]|nr:hypothetical protein [Blastocatellia bacterium]
MTDQKAKSQTNYVTPEYISKPTSVQWVLPTGSVSISKGDVDGDGKDELVIANGNRTNLGVLSYFKYSDISPNWSESQASGLMADWQAQDSIPASSQGGTDCQLRYMDQFFAANLVSSEQAQVVAYNPRELTFSVLEWNNGQLQTLWSVTNSFPGWIIESDDQFFVGDFDGDGKDELVGFKPDDQIIGIIEWDGTQ